MVKTNIIQTLFVVVGAFLVGELVSYAILVGDILQLTVWIFGFIWIINIWRTRI